MNSALFQGEDALCIASMETKEQTLGRKAQRPKKALKTSQQCLRSGKTRKRAVKTKFGSKKVFVKVRRRFPEHKIVSAIYVFRIANLGNISVRNNVSYSLVRP